MAKRARRKMTKVPLSEVKDNFSEFIKQAGKEDVVITIHGRPTAVIIGFEDEDDWLEYCLLNNDEFLAHIAESKKQYQEGKYRRLEELS
jgi:prevent-host-death family protein